MDPDDGALKGASQASWFFTKAKVALAVAVIKNKPPDSSAREHAEALAGELRSREDSWREKAQELEREVLRLRQEMVITRATSETRGAAATAGPDSVMEDVSQDLFDPSDPQPGSDSETPELLQQDPPSATSTPQPPAPPRHHRGCQERAMFPHVQFLQSLCALQRVEGNNSGPEALWFAPDVDAGSVLVDSVCQLLDSVVAACRDPSSPGPRDLVPRNLVLEACRVAARAMDLYCSQRLPSSEFIRHVEGLLRELTGMLLHSHLPGGLRDAEELTELLVVLGSSRMSTHFLVRHVLSQISDLADQLWQSFQGQGSSGLDQFPVDQYQNSCHLFRILEELLQKSKVPCRVEVESEQTGFLSHLQQRVFQLSDEFPLFSICMWRIGGLLTSSDR